MRTLYDVLHPDEAIQTPTSDETADTRPLTAKQFCENIIESAEFRRYLTAGITLGTLPSAIVCRILDHAWGKPPDRVEHTGKDGEPIETITEVRRVVVRVNPRSYDEDEEQSKQVTMH